MKAETLKKIEKGLEDLLVDVVAEVEEDRNEKKEVLRTFARISLSLEPRD